LHGRGARRAALGIPPGTVKSRSYYALRALRDAHAGGLRPHGTVGIMNAPDSPNSTSDHADIAGYLLETLTEQERQQADAHLAECAECRNRGGVTAGMGRGAARRARGHAAGRTAGRRRSAAAADPCARCATSRPGGGIGARRW
jgi:hypothetical protein